MRKWPPPKENLQGDSCSVQCEILKFTRCCSWPGHLGVNNTYEHLQIISLCLLGCLLGLKCLIQRWLAFHRLDHLEIFAILDSHLPVSKGCSSEPQAFSLVCFLMFPFKLAWFPMILSRGPVLRGILCCQRELGLNMECLELFFLVHSKAWQNILFLYRLQEGVCLDKGKFFPLGKNWLLYWVGPTK